MKHITDLTHNGLFNIEDEYSVFKDEKGYYGICPKGETVTHCGYKTIEACLRSKNIPRRVAVYANS